MRGSEAREGRRREEGGGGGPEVGEEGGEAGGALDLVEAEGGVDDGRMFQGLQQAPVLVAGQEQATATII